MNRVFIPQVPMRLDPNHGMVPKFDTLEQARKFGRLVVLIDTPMSYANRPECMEKIKNGLLDYGPQDLFLPMGSHFFMMVAAIIISKTVNSLNILEWNGRDQQYRKSVIDVKALMPYNP